MTRDPVFLAYTLTVVVHTFNLLVLWHLSSFARVKTRSTMNPEDAATIARGAQVVTTDPPEVARMLRVHRNTFDNTIPFLLLALLFVSLRPDLLEAQILLGTFTVARIVFSITYVAGLQPWRTISYVIGSVTTVVLMFEVCRLAFFA